MARSTAWSAPMPCIRTPFDGLGGHGAGRVADDLREVHPVDDLVGEGDQVHLVEDGVDDLHQVDPLQDDAR